jgi:trk system potassium uptake protein TrkH
MKVSINNRLLQYLRILTTIASIAAFVSLILKYGFYLPGKWIVGLVVMDEAIAIVFIITIITGFLISQNKWQFIKDSPFEVGLLLLFIISLVTEEIISVENPHYFLKTTTSVSFIKLYFVIIQVYILINALINIARTREKWHLTSLSPARIMILSYFVVIFTGSLLLKLPKATYFSIHWIDSLFISSSAVCVTGLSTLNLSEVFTFEGQLVILMLIQLGGLGIVALTSFIALFISKGLRLHDNIMVKEVLSAENFNSLRSIIKAIFVFTFVTELIGAVGLYFAWGNLGLSEFDRIFSSIFHSVSAYCNSGFSIFPQGLQTAGYNFSGVSLVIIMLIIILGGIGFYTLSDIVGIGEKSMINKPGQLTQQSKIILKSTLILILCGAFLIWIMQIHQWKGLPAGRQVLNAFFLSITSRTAGFSPVEISKIAIPTAMIIILLMYVGAAPNSTAGGIKVTTGLILLHSFVAFAKGKNRVEIGWNTIPMITVRKAFIVFIVSIILIFLSLLIMSITEKANFFDIFFEIFSAFGTVGLSRGITPDLTGIGKIVLMVVMLSGKIGLFTLAVAMSRESEGGTSYYFPEISLMI